jgi:hypothetical protein
MTNTVTDNKQSGSAYHLKSVFDQSLAILCDSASSVRARRSYLPLHIDEVNLQKRALSDAAKALAALWRISEGRPAKFQGRAIQSGTIQYSR